MVEALGADLTLLEDEAGRVLEALDVDLTLLEGVLEALGADLTLLEDEGGRVLEALGADLTLLEGEDDREVEALGADLTLLEDEPLDDGLLADLDGAGRDTRAGADLAGAEGRDFATDLGADLLAGADLAEDPDDLPLCRAALPNVGPKAIIAVNSTANNFFSTCLVNISHSLSSILVIYNGYDDYSCLIKQYATNDRKSSFFFIFVNFFLHFHVNCPKHLFR